MPFTIRALQADEVEAFRELRLLGFKESNASFSESYEDEVSRPKSYFLHLMGISAEHFTLGAFSPKGKLVAQAIFKRDPREKARHKSMIHAMFVNSAYRRQGISRAMLKEIIQRARALPGLEQIHLWVLDPHISAAVPLYEAMGFHHSGPVVEGNLIIDGKYVNAGYMVWRK